MFIWLGLLGVLCHSGFKIHKKNTTYLRINEKRIRITKCRVVKEKRLIKGDFSRVLFKK